MALNISEKLETLEREVKEAFDTVVSDLSHVQMLDSLIQPFDTNGQPSYTIPISFENSKAEILKGERQFRTEYLKEINGSTVPFGDQFAVPYKDILGGVTATHVNRAAGFGLAAAKLKVDMIASLINNGESTSGDWGRTNYDGNATLSTGRSIKNGAQTQANIFYSQTHGPSGFKAIVENIMGMKDNNGRNLGLQLGTFLCPTALYADYLEMQQASLWQDGDTNVWRNTFNVIHVPELNASEDGGSDTRVAHIPRGKRPFVYVEQEAPVLSAFTSLADETVVKNVRAEFFWTAHVNMEVGPYQYIQVFDSEAS